MRMPFHSRMCFFAHPAIGVSVPASNTFEHNHGKRFSSLTMLTNVSTPWSRSWFPRTEQCVPSACRHWRTWRPRVMMDVLDGFIASPENRISGFSSRNRLTRVANRATPPHTSSLDSPTLYTSL